jgi:nucleotide-binding universal stress UspA family protein
MFLKERINMFQRILVPLDGSVRAQQALSSAACLARASGGTVVLLRVVNTQSIAQQSLSSPLPSAAMQTMLEVERDKAMRYLTEVAASQDLYQVRSELITQVGAIAPTILNCANEQRCDLLILSRQGQSSSAHWLLGSVAEKVLHNITLPVLLLHDSSTTQGLKALIALDGSANAEAAVPLAAQLASWLSDQGSLTFLHILNMPEEISQNVGLHQYLVHDGQRYLSQKIELLRQQRQHERKFTTTWTLLQGEDTAQTLLDALESGSGSEDGECAEPYNLLVMTTSGRGNAGQHMLGSVTERILHASHCSLFIVEPQWQLTNVHEHQAGFVSSHHLTQTGKADT